MPIARARAFALSLAAALLLPTAQAQTAGKLDFNPPELPAELKGLTSLQQIGGACDMLFNRTTKTLTEEYFRSADSERAGTVFGWVRALSARRQALETAGVTGMGIATADIPVIQKAFRAPNMSPAGMERAFKFCDALGDSVTSATRQAFNDKEWGEFQTEVSRRALKTLLDGAPKARE